MHTPLSCFARILFFQPFDEEQDSGEYQCIIRNDAGWTALEDAYSFVLKPWRKNDFNFGDKYDNVVNYSMTYILL